MNVNELREARKKDIAATIEFKEPTRVPVGIEVITWPIAYAGYKTEDVIQDPDLMVEAYTKVFDNLYLDCTTMLNGINMPIAAIKALGSDGYVVSKDGVTIQHVQNTVMREDEYPKLINDTRNFMLNELPLRKFKKLTGSDEEAYAALKESIRLFNIQSKGNAKIAETIDKKYGVPNITGPGGQSPPLDVLFDVVRGFKETIADLRRRPKEVEAALEALYEFGKPANTEEVVAKNQPFPFAMTALHTTPFINKKQMDEYWWPYMKKIVQRVVDAGGKFYIKGEGNTSVIYDYMKEFPKGTFVLHLGEEDDVYEAYEKIGDLSVICAGLSPVQMKYLSKEKCLDEAKRIVDTLAPGGGFIWMPNRPLLCADDVNVDNLFTVYSFVHEYGKY
ncbi:uroporphyrinogen decarboxylase (URO-D) [Oxobacter pfennigii]|uniref:Uroporphyrinogen decarboxylase (URO-D) n=1 Tax=Oxobacter pfennigii TaxID=36849 RepID=A0A0P8YS78_9CLOT|nr:uroporphyrinogen decarboxylase family protein [Oxobacter pfennigii]KPU42506.1 uroporphyrinogen decarboxylase (URO-D) [Oxobacter pfennigii]